MQDHYFANNPHLAHDYRQVEIRLGDKTHIFTTDSGTFSRERWDEGSRLMVTALPPLTGMVADIGCGWGGIGLPAALLNPNAHFVLIDINERAVRMAQKNIVELNINNARAQCGDGLNGINAAFDAVLLNPPIRAGKKTVFDLYAQAYQGLKPGAVLYIVIRKQQGAPSTKTHLEEMFADVQVMHKKNGYWIIAALK